MSFLTKDYIGKIAYLTTDETEVEVTVKKVGRVHMFVFKGKQCVGVLVKRPDVAMMIRRKDIFAPLSAINFQGKALILDADYEKQASAFLKTSNIKLSQTFVYDAMNVATESGVEVGTIDCVKCTSKGSIEEILVSDGAASDKLLGVRVVPENLVVGMRQGTGQARLVNVDEGADAGVGVFVVKEEAKNIKLAGGATEKLAETSVKVKDKTIETASNVKRKAVPAVKKGKDVAASIASKGAKKARRDFSTTKAGILGFKDEFKKAYSDDADDE